MSALLLAALITPLVAALFAGLAGPRFGRAAARMGVAASGFGFLAAAVLALEVWFHGPVSATLRTGHGALVADITTTRLGAVLLFLVYGVSAVVQMFAVRYLAGDERLGWFVAGAGLLTSASAGLMTSGTLIGLAVCWTVAGTALCLLLATYWQLPAARLGVRRTGLAFLLGDIALWLAVGLLTAQLGNVELRSLDLGRFAQPTPTHLTSATLIVFAALSRSAQLPFHKWLPATLAAPTPVSALLHAGVVNAGGVLLVRLSPIVSGSAGAMVMAFTAGALSVAYGAVVMLTKPDIKGSLVYSTMAQMGFMIMTCGLGMSAAAVIHLVGHGFYKATLFLSSGSAVAQWRRKAARPAPPLLSTVRRRAIRVGAILLPAGALGAATALIPISGDGHGSAAALLVFAWATAAVALGGWLARCPRTPAVLAGAAAMMLAALGYVGLVSAVTGFLAPDLPPVAAPSIAPVAICAVAVLLSALAILSRGPLADRAARLHNIVYVRALSAGYVPAARPAHTRPYRPAPLPVPNPVTRQLTGVNQ